MVIKDTVETFYIYRTYQSVHENKGGLLGSRWYLNIGSWLYVKEDRATAILPDMHLERFTRKGEEWENDHNGDRSVWLRENRDGCCLTIMKEHDANGKIIKKIQPEQYDEKTDDGAGYAYDYDCVNRLVQVTAPDGVVVRRYVYDAHENITKAIDGEGYASANNDRERIGTLYQYNSANECESKSKKPQRGNRHKYKWEYSNIDILT